MKLSLAGWSLNREFRREENPLQLLDFPRVAKERFGIEAVELNSPFFASAEPDYLEALKAAAAEQGVKLLNIAVDGTGNAAALDEDERRASVEQSLPWIQVAKDLGCEALRFNTGGHGAQDDPRALGACIRTFTELGIRAKQLGITVLIENHWGVSEVPDRIVAIIDGTELDNVAALPDFGNFPDHIDRYEGLAKLAPFAKAVHAKFYEFDADGEDTKIDAGRCVRILKDSGYDGYLGIEFEGGGEQDEGVRKSIALLQKYL